MMPRPSRSVRMKSFEVERRLAEEFRRRPGFPAPEAGAGWCRSSPSRRCRIALVSSAALLGDVAEHRAQILEIEQQQPLLVGDAEGDVEHAFLHSLRSIRRDSSSGPISEMVARTGWPCSPNKSQNTTGKLVGLIVEAEAPWRARRRFLGLAAAPRRPRGRP